MKQKIINDFINLVKKTYPNIIIHNDLSERLIHSNDNSIYTCLPAAVFYPKKEDDISSVLKIAQEKRFESIHFSAKGGATGCNGQSLNSGIIIDFSRFMTRVIDCNLKENYIDVEPGITLHELNTYLKNKNRCFEPQISPADRACIGGMMSTDASGQGSTRYGRTSQHILACDVVMINGTKHHLQTIKKDSKNQEPVEFQAIFKLILNNQKIINKIFPPTLRFLTGYNLKHIYNQKTKQLSLIPLFAGAEGTLGFITKIRLKLSPQPQKKRLYIIEYNSIESALLSIPKLNQIKARAIEIIDENIIKKNEKIKKKLTLKTKAVNFIEIDEFSHENKLNLFLEKKVINFSHFIVCDEDEAKIFWNLRKESVGKLSQVTLNKQAIPFMEDHAVSPENLFDYIKDIKDLFKKEKVDAAMYGHADVGCIHFRPQLNLNEAEDYEKFKRLQKKAIEIVFKYQGSIWSEHGKGFRNEKIQAIFKEAYPLMQEIKSILDPLNRCNPNKIVAPKNQKIKGFSSLGPLKNTTQKSNHQEFKNIYDCNGNGLCHSSKTNNNMCPSYKYSKNKSHSPKGRSLLLKYWLEHLKVKKRLNHQEKTFCHQLEDNLAACLSCKACSTLCPVKIDIPRYKSLFFEWQYQIKKRPLQHMILASFETTVCIQKFFKKTLYIILTQSWIRNQVKKYLKLENIPKPSLYKPIKKSFQKEFKNTLYVIQDPVTALYRPHLYDKLYLMCQKKQINIYMLPYRELGKSKEVLGYRKSFQTIALQNIEYFLKIAERENLICLEPSYYYCLTEEYKQIKTGLEKKIISLQNFLKKQKFKIKEDLKEKKFQLFLHCMEQNYQKDRDDWKAVFNQQALNCEILQQSCCGQAGLYGYLSQNKQNSDLCFKKGWLPKIKKTTIILNTGFSCQEQLKRNRINSFHPLEIFL